MHGDLGSMGSPDAIDKLCSEVDVGGVGIVQAADRLETLLLDSALMHEEEGNPRYVGYHPLNRDRYGGSGLESLELLSQIAAIGFSKTAMSHAIMEETAPGDTTFQLFSERIGDGNKRVAPSEPGGVRFG